jgi:hypothetical protein
VLKDRYKESRYVLSSQSVFAISMIQPFVHLTKHQAGRSFPQFIFKEVCLSAQIGLLGTAYRLPTKNVWQETRNERDSSYFFRDTEECQMGRIRGKTIQC